MAIVLALSILPDILHLHFEHSHLIFCHTYIILLHWQSLYWSRKNNTLIVTDDKHKLFTHLLELLTGIESKHTTLLAVINSELHIYVCYPHR